MKKLLLVISILLLPILLSIDGHQSMAQTDDLDTLVKALQAKYVKLTTLSADFTQIYTSPGDRPRTASPG